MVKVPKIDVSADGQVVEGGEEEIGVMMGWEQGIMEETVKRLVEGHLKEKSGLTILNIGFGLGIVRSCPSLDS